MINRLKYNSPKRLSKELLRLVNTPNARKHAERKEEIYRKNKGKGKARR
jgi:hypothetical protein